MTLAVDIFNGTRSKDAAQAAFAGEPDSAWTPVLANVGWYDTSIDPNEGWFCLVTPGSQFEDLVGDIVRFTHHGRWAHVLCLGSNSSIPDDIALSRRAWLDLEMLWRSEVRMKIERVATNVT